MRIARFWTDLEGPATVDQTVGTLQVSVRVERRGVEVVHALGQVRHEAELERIVQLETFVLQHVLTHRHNKRAPCAGVKLLGNRLKSTEDDGNFWHIRLHRVSKTSPFCFFWISPWDSNLFLVRFGSQRPDETVLQMLTILSTLR